MVTYTRGVRGDGFQTTLFGCQEGKRAAFPLSTPAAQWLAPPPAYQQTTNSGRAQRRFNFVPLSGQMLIPLYRSSLPRGRRQWAGGDEDLRPDTGVMGTGGQREKCEGFNSEASFMESPPLLFCCASSEVAATAAAGAERRQRLDNADLCRFHVKTPRCAKFTAPKGLPTTVCLSR